MATSGQLRMAMAEVLGIAPATTETSYRLLREASMVSVSGRGRSAANMTPRDAATLFVGLSGSDRVTDAVATVRQFGATKLAGEDTGRMLKRLHDDEFTGVPELKLVGEKHSFLDAVEALFAAGMSGSLEQDVTKDYGENVRVAHDHKFRIFLHGPLPMGRILISNMEVARYCIPIDTKEFNVLRIQKEIERQHKELSISSTGDRERSTSVTARTFIRIGQLLRT